MDGIIKNLNSAESSYDGWLDKYNLELLDSKKFIVELGCGWGDDTGYLSNLPARLLSCDYSSEDLIRVCFEGMEIGTRTGNGTELGAEAETRTRTGLEIGDLREYVCRKYLKEKIVWEFECKCRDLTIK